MLKYIPYFANKGANSINFPLSVGSDKNIVIITTRNIEEYKNQGR